MANELWQEEEKKFLTAIHDVKIPNQRLDDVACVIPHSSEDLDQIPQSGGCYWIWTNEPVLHCLHKNKNPELFDDGEIIYNGIAKDNVRGRAKHHLFGELNAGWSGISLDIHFGATISHRKKALSENGKVPFIKEKYTLKRGIKSKSLNKGDVTERLKPIRRKEDLLQLYLSEAEKSVLNKIENEKIYFRNGVNIN